MNWYLKVLRQYFDFQGRARRKEYWMFVLFSFIASIVLVILENLIGMPSVLSGLYSLATLLPSLGVAVRRLHDTNRSGWWLFIGLVPFVGGIILLVFCCLDGEPEENRFGPSPKSVENPA